MAETTAFRFFAAARAALGVREASSTAATLGAALDEIARFRVPADPERWRLLVDRCSYLIDGESTRDLGTRLDGVALVDVMPPFAGG